MLITVFKLQSKFTNSFCKTCNSLDDLCKIIRIKKEKKRYISELIVILSNLKHYNTIGINLPYFFIDLTVCYEFSIIDNLLGF